MQNLKLIVLMNQQILVSQIEEVGSELGEPDCKLIDPYLIDEDNQLNKFLNGYSDENIFMIHSDKILTITNPSENIVKKYKVSD
mgnify:CR=1 FL=1